MEAGLLRDVWTASSPTRPQQGHRRASRTARPASRAPSRSRALRPARWRVVRSAASSRRQFRFIVSPLVAWIWLGGLIVFAGGLIALWPAPDAARGRARAGYAARVARTSDRA